MARLFRLHLVRSFTIALAALVMAPAGLAAHGPLHDQIVSVTRQIENDPLNPSLYVIRGELYRLHGECSRARSDLDRAGRIDPKLEDVHLGRAFVFGDMGRHGEALRAIDRYLSQDPQNETAILFRARTLSELGRKTEAVAEMDRAIALVRNPTPEQYLERAHLVAADVTKDGARRVVSVGPSDIDAIDLAIRGLDEGMQRLGVVVSLQLYAIELEQVLRRYDRALERLDELSRQYDRQETILARRGEILEAAGRYMEAQVAYTEALDAIEALPRRKRQARTVSEVETFVRARLRSDHLAKEER